MLTAYAFIFAAGFRVRDDAFSARVGCSEGLGMTIRPLRDLEKDAILEAIIATGSIAQAAIKLQISRSRIQRLLRQHNLTLKVSSITAELRKQQKLL